MDLKTEPIDELVYFGGMFSKDREMDGEFATWENIYRKVIVRKQSSSRNIFLLTKHGAICFVLWKHGVCSENIKAR